MAPDLSYDWRVSRKKKGEDSRGDEKEEEKKACVFCPSLRHYAAGPLRRKGPQETRF